MLTEEEAKKRAAEFSPNNGREPLNTQSSAPRSMPTVDAAYARKGEPSRFGGSMSNDDLVNDALDGKIQEAVGQSRGNTLHGMQSMPIEGIKDGDYDDNGMRGIAKTLTDEDLEEEKKKKSGGGMDIGSIAGMAGSFMGG